MKRTGNGKGVLVLSKSDSIGRQLTVWRRERSVDNCILISVHLMKVKVKAKGIRKARSW